MTDTWFSGIFPGSKQSAEIDTTVAHPARVYDYWLGGKDNFAADREAAERVLAVAPGLRFRVKANRAFLARAVRFLATDCGIRQFLDIGTGIPPANNTHEVAQAAAPASRIVYVDNDPIVLAHARALLTSTPEGATAYLEADLREPDGILAAARQTLDFRQPVALMLVGILHLIQDAEEPYQIVSHLMDALPSGSYLIIRTRPATSTPIRPRCRGATTSGWRPRRPCAATRRCAASSTACSWSRRGWCTCTRGGLIPTTSRRPRWSRRTAAWRASPDRSPRAQL